MNKLKKMMKAKKKIKQPVKKKKKTTCKENKR